MIDPRVDILIDFLSMEVEDSIDKDCPHCKLHKHQKSFPKVCPECKTKKEKLAKLFRIKNYIHVVFGDQFLYEDCQDYNDAITKMMKEEKTKRDKRRKND
jgi:hypothetical protein